MWNRLFGKPKPKKAAATLDDASKSVETRGASVDEKVKKMDAELAGYKKQMSKMKPGPARKQVEQRALRLLKQKKMYEKQRDSLYNQQFNIDQTKFAQENVKESVTMVEAMKNASTELKTSMKEIDIDAVEDLHDDMSDMLEMTDEIQEVMGRSYDTQPVDEDELLDELNQLEDTIEVEESNQVAEAETDPPAYLVSAASAANKITSASAADQKDVKVAAPAKQAVTVSAGGGSSSSAAARSGGAGSGGGGGGGAAGKMDLPSVPTRKLMG